MEAATAVVSIPLWSAQVGFGMLGRGRAGQGGGVPVLAKICHISLGGFGQTSQASKPQVTSQQVGWDQPGPRKYYSYIDSSIPLAPGISFVFVWTVVGLTHRKSQPLPTPSSLIAKAFD